MYDRNQKLISVDIKDEMKDSYISYAMSVIVGRALPDIRDGLKPVHRRIIYAMKGLGLEHNKPYRKCARIVGEVLGKYHPHGDAAVYDALVRMAQDFSMRYPLIDGQGNFGSIDGDSPAAMRYTEARLADLTEELIVDIDKETVEFTPNFDESLREPTVLPAKVPNLLINGSSGIAVGMATNIPPHNLSEVIDATIAFIENQQISIEELMKFVKGPDFPTGGIVYGIEGLKEAYNKGKGIIKIQAKTFIEKMKGGKEAIIIRQIPYLVNKTNLIEQIANLVREKKVDGIVDLRDESDKEGIRIVIEVRKSYNPQIILNQLYKHTQLETSFGIIFLALVNNRPSILNLKQLISYFVEHRKEIVIRRTQYELKKGEKRAHILEGLKIAISNLDKTIKLIRSSKSVEEAREKLIKNLKITEIQAKAILELQLQKLTRLERDKLDQEYLELLKKIEIYKSILASERKVLEVIKEELSKIKKKYQDERLTEIIEDVREFKIEDFVAEEDMVITISHAGYIKRQALSSYHQQRRGGKGVSGMDLKEGDFVQNLFIASTHDWMLFFTNKGKCYGLKVHEIPQASRSARGKAIVNILRLDKEETITSSIPVRNFEEERYLILLTRNGLIKRMKLSEFKNPRRKGVIAVNLRKNDSLISAEMSEGDKNLLLITAKGKSILFPEEQVRIMGRTAMGVRGIKLGKEDKIVSLCCVGREGEVLSVTSNGNGKRTRIKNYRKQARAGKGIINMKIDKKSVDVVGAELVSEEDELMLLTEMGQVVRCRVKEIRSSGRNTRGVRVIALNKEDKVISIAKIVKED
jgi:DNA gyrase subunit A